jgi:RHS repeat-associated protein
MISWSGPSCSPTVAGNPTYYVEDLLGTSRVITTNTGVVCYDADFYPFGGERAYTNTCPQNYKFEGKERDTETGNDDFGARYYSNRFGRWLSADWSAVPAPVPYANLTNPQTLNLYAMVADDPESFADLQGHEAGYYYAHDGSMIAPGDPNYPESAHRIRDTVLLGLGTLAALAGPAGGVIARNLLGWGLATAPVTMPIVTELLEGMTPGQRLTLGRAGAMGVGTIEKLGESGFVGALTNGAKISIGFERSASSLGVNISSIETAAKGSVNFKALESSALNLAKSEKVSSVTVKALNVTNDKLAQALTQAGYVAQTVKDAFGRVTTNYVKTFTITKH